MNTKAYNEWGVPNQLVIVTGVGRYFQSYDSIVAVKFHNGFVHLDENKWNFSKTTGKYRNLFLGETKKKTQAKIDSGEYILTNLN